MTHAVIAQGETTTQTTPSTNKCVVLHGRALELDHKRTHADGPKNHPPPFFRWEENGKLQQAGSPESSEKKEPSWVCLRTQFHGIPCALAGCKASHAGSFLRSIVRSGQRRVVFQKKPAPSPDLVHENETPMKLIALRYYRMGILCLQRFCGEMGSSRNNITLQGFG
jgi:hypothetical protein